MNISIRNAVKNILSEKYNRNNIIIYFILTLICVLISYFIQTNKNSDIGSISLLFGLLIIFMIITSGYYCISVNEAIHKEQDIMPNLFKNFGKIAKTGISVYFAMILITIIMVLFFCILYMFKLPLLISIIITCIYYIFCILTINCLTLNFYVSLNWKKLFNVKLAIELLSKKEYWHYIFKLVLLFLLVIPITFVGIIGISIILVPIPQANAAISGVLGAILGGIIGCSYAIICIDLSAQLMKNIIQKRDNQ